MNHQVVRVGAFKTSGAQGGTLAGAVRAFGRPSRIAGGGDSCDVRWAPRQINAVFANFGGRNACTPAFGRVQSITVRSSSWRTQNGLRVGADSSSVLLHHAGAEFHRDGWWLYQAISPFGDETAFSLLTAVVSGGRIRALRASVGAAGE